MPDTSEKFITRVAESFKHCESIAKGHYENFPVGSFLIPADKRKYVWSIYAFARYADDIADSDSLSTDMKLTQLNLLDMELSMIYAGKLDDISEKTGKFMYSLWKTREDLEIPEEEFSNLLKAFKQDSVKNRYDNFSELIDYSKLSANPIGHLILYVFGYKPAENGDMFEWSDNICTGLQLTNFWQDVSVDLAMDRVYIPGQIMDKYGYSYDKLDQKVEDENFKKLMKELVDNTEAIFNEGKGLIAELKGRLKLEIKATYLGGNRILKKIKNINYKVLSERVKLTKTDTIALLLQTMFGKV